MLGGDQQPVCGWLVPGRVMDLSNAIGLIRSLLAVMHKYGKDALELVFLPQTWAENRRILLGQSKAKLLLDTANAYGQLQKCDSRVELFDVLAYVAGPEVAITVAGREKGENIILLSPNGGEVLEHVLPGPHGHPALGRGDVGDPDGSGDGPEGPVRRRVRRKPARPSEEAGS
jgi:hypothetical protein